MSPSGQFTHAGLVWDWSTAEYAPGKLYVFLLLPNGFEEHVGECLKTEDPERLARRYAEEEMRQVDPTPERWRYNAAASGIYTEEEGEEVAHVIAIKDEHVVLMAAAPEMRDALADLIDWAASMGGFEAEVWERARKALDKAREVVV